MQGISYMNQQLTLHAFSELFTDDDMNRDTMRQLLERVSKGNDRLYTEHASTLATATQVQGLSLVTLRCQPCMHKH